jgi:hypothetical protein
MTKGLMQRIEEGVEVKEPADVGLTQEQEIAHLPKVAAVVPDT